MDALTGQVQAIMERLGRTFLLAAYLPAALFLVAQLLFVLPGAPIPLLPQGKPTTAATSAVGEAGAAAQVPDSQSDGVEANNGESPSWVSTIASLIANLLLPVLLGILLLALNAVIIRFFEGAFRWEQWLLSPLTKRQKEKARSLYGKLVGLKGYYTSTLQELLVLPPGQKRESAEQRRVSLTLEIQKEHDRIDKEAPLQTLPRRAEMVLPTSLGNAFAVLEEYSYERYGMDAMIFWPRLRPLVEEPFETQLVNTKVVLDMVLNVALLAGIFGVECLVLALLHHVWLPIVAGVIAITIGYAAYQGGVQAVLSLQGLVAQCFDFYRKPLLKKFDLIPPDDLEAEQAIWLQLGQFLRRGEGFYYPHQFANKGSRLSNAEDTEKGTGG
jgi:hypothetical protein